MNNPLLCSCGYTLRSLNSRRLHRCFCCRTFNKLDGSSPFLEQSDLDEFCEVFCDIKDRRFRKAWKEGARARLCEEPFYNFESKDLRRFCRIGFVIADAHLIGESDWPIRQIRLKQFDDLKPRIFAQLCDHRRHQVFIEDTDIHLLKVCTKDGEVLRQWVAISDVKFEDGSSVSMKSLAEWRLLP